MNRRLNKVVLFKWQGYLVAVGFVALATWLKYLAQPNIIPADVPILYILAIVPAAVFFGFGPSILVCILSLLAYDFFFIPPLQQINLSSVQEAPIVLIFLLVGVIISYLSSNLRKKNQLATKEICSREKTELELAEYRDHLEDLVKQRTAAEIQALARLEERNRQNSIMSEMMQLLQSCSTTQEMPSIVIASVTRLFPNTDGALFLMNNLHRALQSVAKWGDFPEEVDENIFKPDACWGLRRGRVHLVEDAGVGPLCLHLKHRPFVPYLCVPLIGKGEVLGLLHLRLKIAPQKEEKQKNISELEENAILFSQYLALSIANIRLWEKLADQSIRDPLTKLYNRRYMEEMIQREILRAERKQTKIGIIMADIDHLKIFNDTYGHEAGDELLVRLGDLFRLKIRSSDIACRYGGEEFILILPESSNDDTLTRAEYLRGEVNNMKVYFHDQLLPAVSISMGVASYPDNGLELNDLIRAADLALYKAKDQGRNRVVTG